MLTSVLTWITLCIVFVGGFLDLDELKNIYYGIDISDTPLLHPSVCHHGNQYSTQLNSTSIYGRRCKIPQCPHLSSHFCVSSTSMNLIRVLICRRFRSGRPY